MGRVQGRRNPHQSGEVFVRINSSTDNPACLGRNPHRSGEVFARPAGGSALKLPLREKPPPERGGVCEAVSANVAHDRIGETPTEVGVLCETLASTASMSTSEKPPPKWVHRHLPQIFKVLASTIAQSWPVGASQSKTPGEGQGWQARLGARSPGQNPAKFHTATSLAHLAGPGCGR
jgi:hypothetical protein